MLVASCCDHERMLPSSHRQHSRDSFFTDITTANNFSHYQKLIDTIPSHTLHQHIARFLTSRNTPNRRQHALWPLRRPHLPCGACRTGVSSHYPSSAGVLDQVLPAKGQQIRDPRYKFILFAALHLADPKQEQSMTPSP